MSIKLIVSYRITVIMNVKMLTPNIKYRSIQEHTVVSHKPTL